MAAPDQSPKITNPSSRGSQPYTVRVSLRKIIDAPSSTKNEARARDPEMLSTKKGNDWFFGMKAHVGGDAQSGGVHSLETTTAKVHDSQVRDELLHGQETSVWADKGYVSAAREAAFSGPGEFWALASSGASCARPRKAVRFTPSTRTSTGSSPWCGRGSSIRSG